MTGFWFFVIVTISLFVMLIIFAIVNRINIFKERISKIEEDIINLKKHPFMIY